MLKFMKYQYRREAGLIISMAMKPISLALLLKRPFLNSDFSPGKGLKELRASPKADLRKKSDSFFPFANISKTLLYITYINLTIFKTGHYCFEWI